MYIRTILSLWAIISIAGLSFAGDPGKGEQLFMKHCKGCHRLSEGVKMGPSLNGVTSRLSDEWLDKWLEDPKAVVESGDKYAIEILAKFKGKLMPTKKEMKDPAVRQEIISFLKTAE